MSGAGPEHLVLSWWKEQCQALETVYSRYPGVYLEKYRSWAEANPGTLKDTETLLRGLSYILTGYLKESVLLSEFVYSAAQLLTLINNRILSGGLSENSFKTREYSRLEYMLRALRCLEVFLELAALRMGGQAARWALIFSVQVLKTSIRLVLLYRNRRMLLALESAGPAVTRDENENRADYFVLQTSGRVVRSMKGAPPLYRRTWRPPSPTESSRVANQSESSRLTNQSDSSKLTSRKLTAEVIYVLQPLAHLATLGVFGSTSWTPLLLSFGMDCSSLGLYWVERCEGPEERRELARRWCSLLHYILRSPFYDSKSKSIILWFLTLLEKSLPLGGSLVSSIKTYLPEYQKIYFYTWSQE